MKSTNVSRHGTHPAERFSAPAAIVRGSPLAHLIGPRSVELLAESMVAVVARFDADQFKRRAVRGLGKLGFMQRAAHVARALADQLPADFEEAARFLVSSLGPELKATEGNGLAPFFYLPHSKFISDHGVECFNSGMWASYELTKRFTAEFCIRPFLVARQAESLEHLESWTTDANPHVRRAVSEGTRPRLPWGLRLEAFQDDPRPTLALLEKLKDDPVPYVQRSVANHLGDIFKDNPAFAYQACERWIEESSAPGFDPSRAQARRWMVRHALRLPVKKGDPCAIHLRDYAKNSR